MHAARVRVGYERIWEPSPDVKRLLELAPDMQDEVFEKCAEAVRAKILVDEPSTTSPLSTSPEVEEDHKDPLGPCDTDVPT